MVRWAEAMSPRRGTCGLCAATLAAGSRVGLYPGRLRGRSSVRAQRGLEQPESGQPEYIRLPGPSQFSLRCLAFIQSVVVPALISPRCA